MVPLPRLPANERSMARASFYDSAFPGSKMMAAVTVPAKDGLRNDMVLTETRMTSSSD